MSRILKVADWKIRLADFVRSRRAEPFAWGSWDCAMAACSLLQAITGVDPGRTLRGTYSTEVGAALALAGQGYDGLASAIAVLAREHGWQEIGHRYAQAGDIGFVVTDPASDECAMAVMDLSAAEWLVAGRAGGFARVPRARALRAWRVG